MEGHNAFTCLEEIVHVIRGYDAVPLVIPVTENPENLLPLLDTIDGILLQGATSNMHPSRYGEEPDGHPQRFDEARDATDFFLIREARKRRMPVLGICRGMQSMNVALGGSLHQQLPKAEVNHSCSIKKDGAIACEHLHTVSIAPDGILHPLLKDLPHEVCSIHEQAVKQLGKGLRVEARAEDGVVEAISAAGNDGFFLGLQWHPEYTQDHPVSRRILGAFHQAVRVYNMARTAKNMRAVTDDSLTIDAE